MASFGDLAAHLERIAAAADAGAEAAANAMAEVFTDQVKLELGWAGHSEHTKTPSRPGSAPAFISRALRDSLLITPAAGGGGRYLARTGPTTRYARIQERGGMMHAHSPRGMRWQEPPGVWHTSMAHPLPSRPYMKPANELLTSQGVMTEVAEEAFAAVVYAAE